MFITVENVIYVYHSAKRNILTMYSSDMGPMLRIRIFVITSIGGPAKETVTVSLELIG